MDYLSDNSYSFDEAYDLIDHSCRPDAFIDAIDDTDINTPNIEPAAAHQKAAQVDEEEAGLHHHLLQQIPASKEDELRQIEKQHMAAMFSAIWNIPSYHTRKTIDERGRKPRKETNKAMGREKLDPALAEELDKLLASLNSPAYHTRETIEQRERRTRKETEKVVEREKLDPALEEEERRNNNQLLGLMNYPPYYTTETVEDREKKHREEMEREKTMLKEEKKTLQTELAKVYEQVGQRELHHVAKRQKYKAELADLKNSLQFANEKVAQLTELNEKQNREIEVLKASCENDNIIRRSALEKLKRGEARVKEQDQSEFMILRLIIVVCSIVIVLLPFMVERIGAHSLLARTIPFVIFVIIFGFLLSLYMRGKSIKANRKTNVETFIAVASRVVSEADRDHPTPASTDKSTLADHFKPRTVHLKREEDEFGFDLAGAFVSRVERGGPADRVGMQEGDQIVGINDVSVEFDSYEEIFRKLFESEDEIKLVIRFNPERAREVSDDIQFSDEL